MLFAVVRTISVLETRLVEAPDAATAEANADSGRLYQVENLKPGEKAVSTVAKMDDDPSEGEEFDVQINERHQTHILVRAKNAAEAKEKAKQGEGYALHGSEYVETLDEENWNVYDSKGKQVA
jgi:hypothetical protein